MQSAGLVVAPLLAGFTITLIGLLLDTSHGGIAHRDVALLVLIGAVGALLGAMQFAYAARQFAVKPDEIEAWWPGLDDPKDDDVVEQWRELRAEQLAHQKMHERWGKRFRLAYHLGVMLLLVGLAVVLIPSNAETASGAATSPRPTTTSIHSTTTSTHSITTSTHCYHEINGFDHDVHTWHHDVNRIRLRPHHDDCTTTSTQSTKTSTYSTTSTAPVAKATPSDSKVSSSKQISPTRWATIVVAGLLALAEGLWILATELQAAEAAGSTRAVSMRDGVLPSNPTLRLRVATWLLSHRPLGPLFGWLAPSYRDELARARTAIEDRDDKTRGLSAPQS